MMNKKLVIQDELEALSSNFETEIPVWKTIPGWVSYYDHSTNDISFGENAIDMCVRPQLRWLVSHEYYHFLQKNTGRLQRFPSLREYDADRFATEWVYGEWPFPFTDRPTPFWDIIIQFTTGIRESNGLLTDTKVFGGNRKRTGVVGFGIVPVWKKV